MTDSVVASFKKVDFSFNGQPVLRGVTLSVQRGDFVSVIGPNGAGKTTLVRLLMGLLEPQRGEISLFSDSPQATRKLVGYVPQYSSFDHRFPILVREVVRMGTMSPGFSFSRKRELNRVGEALERVGMADKWRRSFAELSGGERQRVLIARALAAEPELLILDEPTSNVDRAAEERLQALLRELNREMTILLVTHDLGFVAPMVNKVLCVNVEAQLHETREVTDEMIRDLFGSNLRFVEHHTHA